MKTDIADTYPYPEKLARGFEDEFEYQAWLSDLFERFGWSIEREVKSETAASRVDIVASHPKWGVFGIECKHGSRPRKIAEAVKQIQKYKDDVFPEFAISSWAIAYAPEPSRLGVFSDNDDWSIQQYNIRNRFYSEFLNAMGIGVLSQDGTVELIFNNSNPMVKIPIARVEYSTSELQAPSIERLTDCDREELPDYLKNL